MCFIEVYDDPTVVHHSAERLTRLFPRVFQRGAWCSGAAYVVVVVSDVCRGQRGADGDAVVLPPLPTSSAAGAEGGGRDRRGQCVRQQRHRHYDAPGDAQLHLLALHGAEPHLLLLRRPLLQLRGRGGRMPAGRAGEVPADPRRGLLGQQRVAGPQDVQRPVPTPRGAGQGAQPVPEGHLHHGPHPRVLRPGPLHPGLRLRRQGDQRRPRLPLRPGPAGVPRLRGGVGPLRAGGHPG